jgi:hypothetical protein
MDYVPMKGDSVSGILKGTPVRGVVLAVKDAETFVLQHRGPYDPDDRRREASAHPVAHFLQTEVKAADFRLVYRKGPAPAAAAPEPKRRARK